MAIAPDMTTTTESAQKIVEMVADSRVTVELDGEKVRIHIAVKGTSKAAVDELNSLRGYVRDAATVYGVDLGSTQRKGHKVWYADYRPSSIGQGLEARAVEAKFLVFAEAH